MTHPNVSEHATIYDARKAAESVGLYLAAYVPCDAAKMYRVYSTGDDKPRGWLWQAPGKPATLAVEVDAS